MWIRKAIQAGRGRGAFSVSQASTNLRSQNFEYTRLNPPTFSVLFLHGNRSFINLETPNHRDPTPSYQTAEKQSDLLINSEILEDRNPSLC
jgi:hypothetical protein